MQQKVCKRSEVESACRLDVEAWAVLLTQLPARVIACVAITCKSLAREATWVTSERVRDASQGRELRPIPHLAGYEPRTSYTWS